MNPFQRFLNSWCGLLTFMGIAALIAWWPQCDGCKQRRICEHPEQILGKWESKVGKYPSIWWRPIIDKRGSIITLKKRKKGRQVIKIPEKVFGRREQAQLLLPIYINDYAYKNRYYKGGIYKIGCGCALIIWCPLCGQWSPFWLRLDKQGNLWLGTPRKPFKTYHQEMAYGDHRWWTSGKAYIWTKYKPK